MPSLKYFSKPFIFFLSTLIGTPVLAHTVQMSGDVGATFHIEPHDNPQAGKPSLAWFALTHRSGRIIPLSQCNCQLAVYAVPHEKNAPPLISPTLKPVNGDRYQGIPGAEITFPTVGEYELKLSGYPKKNTGYNGRFIPFTLTYKIIVAGS
ncbi:MAG: hypothetical protein ACYTXA_04930 [Nostoc sp.]